ncbi:hypothetical protein [Pedobacter psychrodurus]|uniref:hypothetical protein n=1 Tax=Pedobacter psychrodurus TaxID=2530456 RepID=UPI00292F2A28|nr:hypothetical protein [Pedobacter psychrodurus]
MESNMKKLWREKWLNCMNELTSFDLQKKSWLDRTQNNPHWSFVEFMCSYFDDLAVDNIYKPPLDNGWITLHEYEIIKTWHEELAKYYSPNHDDYNHEAILNDPNWLYILKIGVDSKHTLAELLNENEKEILLKEMDYI